MIWQSKDQLNLTVDIRGTISVSNNKENVNLIFNRIPASNTADDRVKVIKL